MSTQFYDARPVNAFIAGKQIWRGCAGGKRGPIPVWSFEGGSRTEGATGKSFSLTI